MKIFNWVHRKFHHTTSHTNLHKDEANQSMEKVEPVAIDIGTQALLGQVTLVDVLDGWKDGILTIGTLGFDDPLKSFNVTYKEIEDDPDEDNELQNSDANDELDEESDEDDEAEENPLVYTAFRNVYKEDIGFENCPKSNMILSLSVNSVGLTPLVGLHDESGKVESDQRKRKGERTTLADLFSADSDIKRKSDPNEGVKVETKKKKETFRAKDGVSFAKKLIPRVGEDSRPIKKLNQLMKRMLKRKIHPELQGKVNKSEGQIKHCGQGLFMGDELGGIEGISLLQTQGVAV